MNFKVLGIIAIICAPFLCIDFATSVPNVLTWKVGLFGFVYMIGWMCSIVALKRMEILGRTKWAKIAFAVQLSLLTLAQIWNLWVILGTGFDNILFRVFDACWPLSNIWMLVIGITAVRAKELQGWKRFVPLFVGLWFPLMIVPAVTMGFFVLAGPYSALAFTLLGLLVFKGYEGEQSVVNKVGVAYSTP
jgi:hypothetical protein